MALAWWPGHGMPLPGLALFAGAFAAYALAATRAGRARGVGARHEIILIWGVAVALRLAVLPVPPELTDDGWRYLWDGHVQMQGINPYLHAPADPALDGVATPWRHRINNPDVPTIYPPVAQLAFLLVAAVGGAVVQLKLLWIGLDLAAGWLLARAAGASGRSRRLTLVLYLWSPLLVVETAWNAHLEVLGLVGIAAVLALAGPDREGVDDPERRERTPDPVGAGVGLAWASLTKLAPLAALPPLARRLGPRFVAAAVGFAALAYLPYAAAGERLLAGLGAYARHWRFNELGFALVETVVPGAAAPRVVVAGVVGAVVVMATVRGFGPGRALLWILGAGLILSPTLHPWYALWILPVAALRRSVPWLLFTGTAFIGYLGLDTYQDTGVWPQPLWGRLVLWLPVLALLAVGAVRGHVPVAPDAAGDVREAEPEVAGGEE